MVPGKLDRLQQNKNGFQSKDGHPQNWAEMVACPPNRVKTCSVALGNPTEMGFIEWWNPNAEGTCKVTHFDKERKQGTP